MGLEGKKILITGAGQRVGRALALAAAREGADLVIHYRSSANEAESLAEEIAAFGSSPSLVKADLGDSAQVKPLVEQAAAGGVLFALINNASIFAPLTWDMTTLESWQQHLTVNLTAPFLLSQAFARQLPPGMPGRIVNLLDWRALRPGADHLPYTVSKAALAALTRSLAVAFAPRITVNGLALGAALPPNEGEGGSVDQTQLDRIIADVPAKRWANLDEVCQAMLFLLEGPAYITGEIIHVDGGRHLV